MSPKQIVASIIISLCVLCLTIRLIQKGRLDIAYCWLWFGVGVTMLLLVVKYEWLVAITHLMGAVLPTTTLFLLSIVFILLMCLQFSIVISRHRREIRKLTQQLALLSRERESSSGAGAAQ